MMLGQKRLLWLQHQRVAVIPVGGREGSVDGNRLATAFERRLALFNLHGNVAVYNDTSLRVDAKFLHHAIAESRLVDELKVGILRFDMRRLISDEVVLQRGDTVLAKERRVRPTP